VVSSLQSRVVGSYPVRGAWFPSRFSLEGTSRIQIFWAVTGNPRYPGYKTSTVVYKVNHEMHTRRYNEYMERHEDDDIVDLYKEEIE
jgi:hypothetical protein